MESLPDSSDWFILHRSFVGSAGRKEFQEKQEEQLRLQGTIRTQMTQRRVNLLAEVELLKAKIVAAEAEECP